MFMLLTVFITVTILRVDAESNTNEMKNTTTFNVISYPDCLRHCLSTPNCKSIKWKNKICNLTLIKNDAIDKSDRIEKIFNLRVKRKDVGESLRAQSSSSNKTKLSFYDRNVRYRNRYRLKTWKEWLAFVIALIGAIIWYWLKDNKKPNASTLTPINSNLPSISTISNDTNPPLPSPSLHHV